MRSQPVKLPDGASTVVEWFGEELAPVKGLVVFLPGLGIDVSYYRGFCESWAKRGYRVGAVEMRGLAQSSVRDLRRQNFGYREVLNVDLATVITQLAATAQGQPVYIAGHSLGGQFALLHASKASHRIDGVVLVAGGSNHCASLPSWQARLKRRFGFWAIRCTVWALGYFPGDKLGFGGRQPRNMMLDWSGEGLTGRFCVIGDEADYNAALRVLNTPVLMLSLSGDKLVPRSSADALALKLERAEVTQLELQAREHGMKVFSHFKWVHRPEIVLDPIDRWIHAQDLRHGRRREPISA